MAAKKKTTKGLPPDGMPDQVAAFTNLQKRVADLEAENQALRRELAERGGKAPPPPSPSPAAAPPATPPPAAPTPKQFGRLASFLLSEVKL